MGICKAENEPVEIRYLKKSFQTPKKECPFFTDKFKKGGLK